MGRESSAWGEQPRTSAIKCISIIPFSFSRNKSPFWKPCFGSDGPRGWRLQCSPFIVLTRLLKERCLDSQLRMSSNRHLTSTYIMFKVAVLDGELVIHSCLKNLSYIPVCTVFILRFFHFTWPISPGAQTHMAPEPMPVTQPNNFMPYPVLLSWAQSFTSTSME